MPRPAERIFVIFKINENKLEHFATTCGVFETCKMTNTHSANVYKFIRGDLGCLKDFIIVPALDKAVKKTETKNINELKEAKEILEKIGLNTDEIVNKLNEFDKEIKFDIQKYYDIALLLLKKKQINNLSVKDFSRLSDEKINTIHELIFGK